MKTIKNPFVTVGYVSEEYFCDRKDETIRLIDEVTNGNNLVLISTRRMGKTGLIRHSFLQKELDSKYYTFFVDIYATKSLRDFTFALSKVIVESLQSFGKKALKEFIRTVKSLQPGITFDISGTPSFNLSLGDIQAPEATLDEIFSYLSAADKPCIVAIDEFQQIISYPENNTEAVLRTHIQHCNNARFIFAGSQRHVLGNIFLGAARPFYQSASMMYLDSIALPEYIRFAQDHFSQHRKTIDAGVIEAAYIQFEGITWYIQKALHVLFNAVSEGDNCSLNLLPEAIQTIIGSYEYAYVETLFRLPVKQKELLIAIAKEGKTTEPTSGAFVKKYKLSSASSVQAALKGLLEKDFITREQDVYRVYDLFLAAWLNINY